MTTEYITCVGKAVRDRDGEDYRSSSLGMCEETQWAQNQKTYVAMCGGEVVSRHLVSPVGSTAFSETTCNTANFIRLPPTPKH